MPVRDMDFSLGAEINCVRTFSLQDSAPSMFVKLSVECAIIVRGEVS